MQLQNPLGISLTKLARSSTKFSHRTSIKRFAKSPNHFAVAGGQSKAKAVNAYMKMPKQTWLITDEACANEILKATL